ncbi:MAG: hypothetical protein ABI811_11900 [Acidobacteriota bacterium]
MKAKALTMIPLFAGALFAQNTETRTTTTTKTTWNGTLVDAACQTTRTERSETSRNTVTKSTTETVDCPVTAATNSFGLLTADGHFIRFDNPSNTRVIEIVKRDQNMNRFLADRTPLRVRVVGSANGDVAVVESLNSNVGDAERLVDASQTDFIFDVKYHGDPGKLVVTAKGVNFEDVGKHERSKSWSYAQIKELHRESDNEVRIEPYTGDNFEFRVDGKGMSQTVYKTIADRIVAARVR